jgi:hypothetical protein
MTKVTLAGLFLFLSFFPLFAEGNIIRNGSFEFDSAGYVAQWTYEAFKQTDEAVRFFASEEYSYDGKRSMAIENIEPNDSKVIQWLEVEPNSLYKLSCWTNVKKAEGSQIGANITVLGIKETSETLLETEGKWRYIEVYGRTAKGQKELAVVARLGFSGHLVTGLAYFDDMRLEKIKDFPGGRVIDFFSSDETFETVDEEKKSDGGTILTALGLFFIIIILVGVSIISFYFIYKNLILPRIDKIAEEFPEELKPKESQPLVNNRATVRKQISLPVLIKRKLPSGAYKEMEFKSHDISRGGMLIMVDDISLFSIGDEIELTIKYYDKVYEVGTASVVRLQKKYSSKGILVETGIGVRFTSTDSKHLYRIKRIAG